MTPRVARHTRSALPYALLRAAALVTSLGLGPTSPTAQVMAQDRDSDRSFTPAARRTGSGHAPHDPGPDDVCTGAVNVTGGLPSYVELMSVGPQPDQNWRRFLLTTESGVRIRTVATEATVDDDTDLTLWDGCPGDIVAYDDDSGGSGFTSFLDLCLAAGTYYLEVGGWNDTASPNDFELRIDVGGCGCGDADGDGVDTCEGDCDDANPHCTTDCTDADADGWCVTTDCNDTRPHCTTDCTDADGDGWCVTTDCDDDEPACTASCSVAPCAVGLTGPVWSPSIPGEIAGVGDVNGDGFDDIVVGSPFETVPPYSNNGRARLYYGSPSGPSQTPAWTVSGTAHNFNLGSSIAPAGDVNGDGYGDFLIRARWLDEGAVWLFRGGPTGPGTTPNWTLSGSQGGTDDDVGKAMASAGDVNGDGYDDVVIGQSKGGSDPEVLLYHGSASGSLTLAWTAQEPLDGDAFGACAATAGDVNGDGYGDVLVCDPGYLASPCPGPGNCLDAGALWVWHGSPTGLGVAPAWFVQGTASSQELGIESVAAGDVDGDGYDDVMFTLRTTPNEVRLHRGSPSGLGTSVAWSITGPSDGQSSFFGLSLAGLGDVDADGRDDALVNFPLWSSVPFGGQDEGRIYLHRGVPGGLETTPSWFAQGADGDHLGRSVAWAGDVNGDLLNDAVATDNSAAYLYFGVPGSCVDADGDGHWAIGSCSIGLDCDDLNPHCATDCTDADGDTWCVTDDCDDLEPACAGACVDADADGVTTCAGDCDDARFYCTTDCTDADADGWCVTSDCNDLDPACTDCVDADGDGVAACLGDCDDTKPYCVTDCTDADGDGWCVTADCDDARPHCTGSCADADGDGYCAGVDCDDARPFCSTSCQDPDGDGYCASLDCHPTNAHCQIDCTDADADGFCVTDDCDDARPGCAVSCADADGDDVCADADCDEANPHCSTSCVDQDGDGWCPPFDCSDTSGLCQADCTDADADGYCVTADCDDSRPDCAVNCADADGDDACADADCDESNPQCAEDCTDLDHDGACPPADCDDHFADCVADCVDADEDGVPACAPDCDESNPHCTTDCADQDADGWCVTTDCDDTQASCTAVCTDADGDGVSVCAGDCDDAQPAVHPGLGEVCTDGLDNDCNGWSDAQDPICSGLATGELRFDTATALHWDPAPAADAHALYRGSIGETGMRGYTHLCEATLLSSAHAVDPDIPPPGQGYYYLAAGLALDPGGAIAIGPLGTASSGAARPDRSGLSCGTRVFVDADVVGGGQTGLSWADAYSSVGVAMSHPRGAGRGIEVWSRQSIEGTAFLSGSLHPGLRLLGGFSGTETAAWERSPELHPTVWDGSGTVAPLIVGSSVDLVIDGVTLRSAGWGVSATLAGDHVVLENVRLEQFTEWGVDLRVVAGGRIVIDGVEIDSPGQGSVRATVRDGVLDGRIRQSTVAGGADGAIVLEAWPTTMGASAETRVDVVANTVAGGARGIVLGARVNNRAATAVCASFVDSNVVTDTETDAIAVEATGTFTSVGGAATVRAAPIVSNNTLDGGQGAGIACRATRSGPSVDPALHQVSCVPELWTNLITHQADVAIEESADDEAAGLVSDPHVVSNGFHGNGALYLDEGTVTLSDVAEVNALAGAAANFAGDPLYVDRDAGDYHLGLGTVLGASSAMRYVANASDPGLGFVWTAPSFDDSMWDEGGYGVGYDSGPDSPPPSSAAALIATDVPAGTLSVFARTTFEVGDASAVTSLVLGADYDDGYVAWINGVEVFRSASMPPGPPSWDTAASPHESSNGMAPAFEEVDISAAGLALLVDGTNVLALGVWNESPASVDLVLVPRLVVNEESPAVDAGLAGAPRVGKEDRDGGTRSRDGDGDGVARPDAGAHER